MKQYSVLHTKKKEKRGMGMGVNSQQHSVSRKSKKLNMNSKPTSKTRELEKNFKLNAI